MSYLSDLKAGALTPLGFLKKSVGWFARQAGLTDDKVDELVKEADRLTDEHVAEVEAIFGGLIAQAFPALPSAAREVLAHRAAVAGLEAIDMGIGAAGAVIKANN